MNFNLIFNKSGDEIKFITNNDSLIEYYVNAIQNSNKNYFLIDNFEFLEQVKYLQQCISDVDNFFVTKLKNNLFSEFVDEKLYNQNVLNRLHMLWVKFQIKNSKMSNLLYKFDSSLLQKFRDINNILHDIESTKFYLRNFNTYEMWSCNNIFGNNIIDFNQYNLSLSYNNLGRNTYDKWLYNDNNVHDEDTADYNTLSGELILSTGKNYTQQAPLEYVEWCKKNKAEVVGNGIGLGNITQPIELVQDLIYRNMQIESNAITIEF